MDFIDHLYIEVDYQGMGIGSTFINMAKQAYPNGLCLYTLASNQRAIHFYQGHGFKITRRGIAPDEGVPDVLMAWQPSPPSVW